MIAHVEDWWPQPTDLSHEPWAIIIFGHSVRLGEPVKTTSAYSDCEPGLATARPGKHHQRLKHYQPPEQGTQAEGDRRTACQGVGTQAEEDPGASILLPIRIIILQNHPNRPDPFRRIILIRMISPRHVYVSTQAKGTLTRKKWILELGVCWPSFEDNSKNKKNQPKSSVYMFLFRIH